MTKYFDSIEFLAKGINAAKDGDINTLELMFDEVNLHDLGALKAHLDAMLYNLCMIAEGVNQA